MTDRPPATFNARMAQPLDDMLRRAGAEGWDFFGDRLSGPDAAAGGREAMAQELEAEAAQVAGDAAAIFATPQGRRVVEFLCDVSLRRPTWLLNFGPEALGYAAMREGQNGLVFTLLKMIATGRQEQQPFREGM